MYHQLTSSELHELEYFYGLEPFGEIRSELRHGQLMALQCNINRDEKNHPEIYKATEFMNFLEKEPERVYTKEELEEYANKIFGV